MNLKLKSILACGALLLAAGQASAAITTTDYGSYTLTFDSATSFGSPAYSFTSSGGGVGFAWSFDNSVNAVSIGGGSVVHVFDLPSFTITAKPGWSLSGPVTGFLGNLAYTEVDGATPATANASVTGTLATKGMAPIEINGSLGRSVNVAGPGYSSGYFSGMGTTPAFSFETLSFYGGTLTLSATGGAFVSITSQPQNEMKVSFNAIAAAVPEPETYAMFLAGLGMMAVIARRRRKD